MSENLPPHHRKGLFIMKKRNRSGGVLAVISMCILAGFSMTATADGIWEITTSRDESGHICIDFQEVQVLLPESWSGKCQMHASGSLVSFCQLKSRELYTQELGYDNGGWLFSLGCAQSEEEYSGYPSYMTLGVGAAGIYYATFPTDVQAYTEDAKALAEYQDMWVDMEWVKKNITVTPAETNQIVTADGDYILPDSSAKYLTESDLEGLDAEEVQMAINEIYARHNRRFLLADVQEYFDSKSWYEGAVEAEDFDVSVMNAYEGYNIDLLTRRLAALGGAETAE